MTLGTGFGTGLYSTGCVRPHIEIAHQPFRKGETYDDQVGEAARKRVGDRKWNRRVREAVENMRSLTHFDHLYLGEDASGSDVPGSPPTCRSSPTWRGSRAG